MTACEVELPPECHGDATNGCLIMAVQRPTAVRDDRFGRARNRPARGSDVSMRDVELDSIIF